MLNNKYSPLANSQRLTIKKSTFEWIGLIALFLFSFLNSITLLISLMLLLTLLKQKQIGAIKIINLITLRTIINSGLAVDISFFQNFKWIILLGCSIYLLLSYKSLGKFEIKRIYWILFILFCFTIYNIFVALVFSSLPVVAIFKLISYIVVFIGTLIGVGCTYKSFDWINWMYKIFQAVMIISLLLIKTPVGYLRTGTSFQGIVNHPNMFGIIAVLFIASLFTYTQINKYYNKFLLIIIPTVTLYTVILSKSRTALISCIILIILYAIFANFKTIKKLIVVSFSMAIIFLLYFGSDAKKFLVEFLLKGQEQGNMLNSRLNQIETLTSNFRNSPIFGNGFAVPVLPYKSYEFSSEFIVEPGNLVLGVLSYCGIIGFIIFVLYISKIIIVNKNNFKQLYYLPLAAILISMGEMVFFSSNNIGVWCYMFLAISVFIDKKN